MPNRSTWDSLTDAAADVAGKVTSIYKNAQAVNARGKADLAAAQAAKAQSSTPTVRRSSTPTPVGTDPATKDLSVSGAANTLQSAPSNIDKEIASMDH